MEEFIDYILYLVLIAVIAFAGTLVFFLITDPTIAYRLLTLVFCVLTGGIWLFARKIHRKKRLGEYYELFCELSHIQKEIQRSTKRLNRHSRETIAEQRPKIRKLCSQAQQRLKKVVEIEKTLRSFDKKPMSHSLLTSSHTPPDKHASDKLHAAQERYLHNIQKIEQSKQQNLQQVHDILRFLHELNSQLQALRFSQAQQSLQEDIAETIDELLIDIQSLEELT